jgi:hypothetical protein
LHRQGGGRAPGTGIPSHEEQPQAQLARQSLMMRVFYVAPVYRQQTSKQEKRNKKNKAKNSVNADK